MTICAKNRLLFTNLNPGQTGPQSTTVAPSQAGGLPAAGDGCHGFEYAAAYKLKSAVHAEILRLTLV
jgi:hypothetical protein